MASTVRSLFSLTASFLVMTACQALVESDPKSLPVLRIYPFPDSSACVRDAKAQCDRVSRVAWCKGCEVQCLATTPPTVSKACRSSHPCSPYIHRYCDAALRTAHPAAREVALLACLRHHNGSLSSSCRETDPCLASNIRACGAKSGLLPLHSHYSAPKHGASYTEDHADKACACLDECGEHLSDAVCEPCGPTCVRNPRCGPGHSFCRVTADCTDPAVFSLGPCSGPYPHHPDCDPAVIAMAQQWDNTPDRCQLQAVLARKGVCPPPRGSDTDKGTQRAARGTHARECKPPPPTHGFLQHMRKRSTARKPRRGHSDASTDFTDGDGVSAAAQAASTASAHEAVRARIAAMDAEDEADEGAMADMLGVGVPGNIGAVAAGVAATTSERDGLPQRPFAVDPSALENRPRRKPAADPQPDAAPTASAALSLLGLACLIVLLVGS